MYVSFFDAVVQTFNVQGPSISRFNVVPDPQRCQYRFVCGSLLSEVVPYRLNQDY